MFWCNDMKKKFEDLDNKIDKLINQLDSKEIMGPISLLEESQELIAQALEEYENYEELAEEYQ